MAAGEEFADRQKILTYTGSFNCCPDIDDDRQTGRFHSKEKHYAKVDR
jgi:hypothetical protein